MIETTVQNPELLETFHTDSQGRVNLGVKFANRKVEVLVVQSEPLTSDDLDIQHTIEDSSRLEYERTGMLFARAFGIARHFLRDPDGEVEIEDGTVQPESIGSHHLDWSTGRLIDHRNVAKFCFDEPEEPDCQLDEMLTAEPVSVTLDDEAFDRPVYRFEHPEDGSSAIAEAFVDHIEEIYGYHPATNPEFVRVHASEAPMPVMFQEPDGETYILVAPRVSRTGDT